MYLQEFKIHLIGGHVLKAAEEIAIPAEYRLLNRFKKAKPEDIVSVGSEETSQAFQTVVSQNETGAFIRKFAIQPFLAIDIDFFIVIDHISP